MIPGYLALISLVGLQEPGRSPYPFGLNGWPHFFQSSFISHAVIFIPTPPPEHQQDQTGPVKQEVLKVPFTPGSPIMVNARVNGVGPISLILDTDSDRTLITSSGLQRLGLSIENAGKAILQGVTGTSQGSAIWVNSVEVGEAKIGPLLF